jgi:hypothetical protein
MRLALPRESKRYKASNRTAMDLVGKYLRLRRELIEALPRSPHLVMDPYRVAQDMARGVAE